MNLPHHDPRPDLWQRIAADLDTDDHLHRLVTELPRPEPAADLWATIEARLDGPATPVASNPAPPNREPTLRPLWNRTPTRWFAGVGAVAASVLLLLNVGQLMAPKPGPERVRVEYATETMPDKRSPGNAVPAPVAAVAQLHRANNQAELLIARHCRQHPTVACARPDVVHLRAQLTQLNADISRIERELTTFGPDPALIRAQTDVERQRADVADALITRIRS